jgi:hypothetical protein
VKEETIPEDKLEVETEMVYFFGCQFHKIACANKKAAIHFTA